MQSTFYEPTSTAFHTAIVMDGNGRWGTRRNLPRVEGHREGAKAVRRVVEAAPPLGITVLTLYAFSSDNWQRPANEVNRLMTLFYDFLFSEKKRCHDNGIRLRVVGRRDRLSPWLRAAVEAAETATASDQKMCLRIAIDYSSRDSILNAAMRLNESNRSREAFSKALGEVDHTGGFAPNVDLLIRTGGEQRLSDFLLWESAYAELYFLETMWPDFTGEDLKKAVESFRKRNRRFGAIPESAVPSTQSI